MAGVGKFHCSFLTQKERDSESGLDYFLARYYSSAQGRFTTADQFDPAIAKQSAPDRQNAEEEFRRYLSQPQHWNRYPYVLNNPLHFIDPNGLQEKELEEVVQRALANFGLQAAQNLGLLRTVLRAVVNKGLEIVFGPNIYISPGGLGNNEVAFAKDIMQFQGKSFVGVAVRNEPGIDGFLMSGGVPVAAVSLTETARANPRVLLDLAEEKELSASKSGFKNVDLYIKATNLTSSQVVEFVGRGSGFSNVTDKGVVKSISVFTNDGKVVQIQGQNVKVCDDKGKCQ